MAGLQSSNVSVHTGRLTAQPLEEERSTCVYCQRRTLPPASDPRAPVFAFFSLVDCRHYVCQPCALVYCKQAGRLIECPTCRCVSRLAQSGRKHRGRVLVGDGIASSASSRQPSIASHRRSRTSQVVRAPEPTERQGDPSLLTRDALETLPSQGQRSSAVSVRARRDNGVALYSLRDAVRQRDTPSDTTKFARSTSQPVVGERTREALLDGTNETRAGPPMDPAPPPPPSGHLLAAQRRRQLDLLLDEEQLNRRAVERNATEAAETIAEQLKEAFMSDRTCRTLLTDLQQEDSSNSPPVPSHSGSDGGAATEPPRHSSSDDPGQISGTSDSSSFRGPSHGAEADPCPKSPTVPYPHRDVSPSIGRISSIDLSPNTAPLQLSPDTTGYDAPPPTSHDRQREELVQHEENERLDVLHDAVQQLQHIETEQRQDIVLHEVEARL
eukprot:gene97-62_t